MPAIDAAIPSTPTAAADLRPAGQAPASPGNGSEIDSHASDAFIAALLAQSTPQLAAAASAPVPAEGSALPVGGQDLPTPRAVLATGAAPRRPAVSLPLDAQPSAPAAQASVAVDGAQEEFAAAFTALQSAMTAATGADRPQHAVADDAAPIGAAGQLPDLTAVAGGAAPRGEAAANQALDALAGAHAVRAHAATAPTATHAAKPAPLPMDQPALFADRLNQHISFMIGDGVQSAQIAVTPAELGPVEVRVTMVGDEAKIQLSATHAATREALNDALPRLRASFAEAGINLGQAGVFAQMPQRQQAEPSFSAQAQGGEHEFEVPGLASVAPARSVRVGLIDAFV